MKPKLAINSRCAVTYDPDYDSPAVLTKFGTTHGLRFERNTLMLQPDSKQKDKLFKALNVGVNYNGQSVNLHSIQLMLFDSQGRYVRTYHSIMWNNQQVIEDLKRLLAETKQALIPGEVSSAPPNPDSWRQSKFFHPLVEFESRRARIREMRSTACFATTNGHDQWLLETPVHGADEGHAALTTSDPFHASQSNRSPRRPRASRPYRVPRRFHRRRARAAAG